MKTLNVLNQINEIPKELVSNDVRVEVRSCNLLVNDLRSD
jgi:hypothetical protein